MFSRIEIGAFIATVVFSASFIFPVCTLANQKTTLAVLPITNEAKLDSSEMDYLSDVVWDVSRKHVSGNTDIISRSKVLNAAGIKANKCNEKCALRVGKKTRSDAVLLVEIRKLGEEYRIVAKLLDVKSGETVDIERERAVDVAKIEFGLEVVIQKLFQSASGSSPHAGKLIPPPPTPAYQPGRFGDLSVYANGIKTGESEDEAQPCAAQVYINGRLVGETPYKDGFPTGKYVVEMKAHNQIARQTVDIVAGEQYEISTTFKIPLSQGEQATIDADKRKKNLAEKEARAKKRDKELKKWTKQHDAWKEQDEAVTARRKPFLISGILLMPFGLGLTITGIKLETNVNTYDSNYQIYKTQWLSSTDEGEIAYARENMDEQARLRDLSHAWGITTLVVGSASIVTSIILFAAMPKRPEEPEKPWLARLRPGPRITVSPLAGPRFAGLGVGGCF